MCAYVWLCLNANLNTLPKNMLNYLIQAYRHICMWMGIVILQTLPRISRCPWLAARWSGVSSPRFITLMRAPLIMSMSTTLERPSRHAQCSGLNPWSSLRHKYREASQSDKISNSARRVLALSWCPDRNDGMLKHSYARFEQFIAYLYFNIAVTVRLFKPSTLNDTLPAVVSWCVQVTTHHQQNGCCGNVLHTTERSSPCLIWTYWPNLFINTTGFIKQYEQFIPLLIFLVFFFYIMKSLATDCFNFLSPHATGDRGLSCQSLRLPRRVKYKQHSTGPLLSAAHPPSPICATRSLTRHQALFIFEYRILSQAIHFLFHSPSKDGNVAVSADISTVVVLHTTDSHCTAVALITPTNEESKNHPYKLPKAIKT